MIRIIQKSDAKLIAIVSPPYSRSKLCFSRCYCIGILISDHSYFFRWTIIIIIVNCCLTSFSLLLIGYATIIISWTDWSTLTIPCATWITCAIYIVEDDRKWIARRGIIEVSRFTDNVLCRDDEKNEQTTINIQKRFQYTRAVSKICVKENI